MENLALTESTYYILLSLYHPQHGYGIMQQTEQLSGGRVHLAAEGVQILKHELARLQQLVANGESILKEEAL